MAALRSSLRMLSCSSSVSSGAAYMGGRGMELNQVLRCAAPPPHTAAIRYFEFCRHFSTDKAESGRRPWWQRVKCRMENVEPGERRRIHFAYTVFVLGTPTALLVRGCFRG